MDPIRATLASLKFWRLSRWIRRGRNADFAWSVATTGGWTPQPQSNPLRAFFDARRDEGGPGICKWRHYFEIYDRHLSRFRGQQAHVLEIGVHSGGSLDMWHDYFGAKAFIYGVDIMPECRAYEAPGIKIFIGDQADRSFWRDFRRRVPCLDIVIDDGGHEPEQQIVSLEELLPFLRPGGVYLCEDIHGTGNKFASYLHGLADRLNDASQINDFPDDDTRRLFGRTTAFQSAIGSIHLYPFVAVLERNATPVTELRAARHGTRWQPF